MRILKITKAPKKDIDLLQSLLELFKNDSLLSEEICDVMITQNKVNIKRNSDFELKRISDLLDKSSYSKITRSEEKELDEFFAGNSLLRQFLNIDDKNCYELLISGGISQFTIAELKFLYVYIIGQQNFPKYSNKTDLFNRLLADINSKIYRTSFEVDNK
jgi:hypothetical protein